MERFTYIKSEVSKKPHIIQDNAGDKAEDPILYHLSSRRKAMMFKEAMEKEHGATIKPVQS